MGAASKNFLHVVGWAKDVTGINLTASKTTNIS